MKFIEIHQPIFELLIIENELKQLNHKIHSAGLNFQYDNSNTSYPVDEMPNNSIMVVASFDLIYYHQLELVFYDVEFHNLPEDSNWRDHWEKDQLVVLKGSDQTKVLNSINYTKPVNRFVFAFNCGSFGDEQYIIIANGLSFAFETVFYYDRTKSDELKVHERVAWWIKRQNPGV